MSRPPSVQSRDSGPRLSRTTSKSASNGNTRSSAVLPDTLDVPYPPPNVTLIKILMTEGVVHGTILRSDSIPSSPSHPSPIPPKVLERKGPSRPAGPLAAMFSKATGSGLYSCAIVALGRRMFLFDAPEPLTADQMVRGPARTTKLDTSPISSIFEPISRTSLSTGAIASPTVYSAHFMRQPAKLVLDVSNVCVTEEGLWLLRVSGPDLTHGGSFRDVYLQANSEEEMVGWMRVLKSWL